MSYGAYLRLPASVGDGLAATQARRLKLPGVPRAIVIFHPLQYPLARGLIARHPDAELWYWRWDRYEAAYDATPRQRERLADLHLAASLRAAVNDRGLRRARRPRARGGRRAAAGPARRRLVPGAGPAATVVAVSLGHLGHRTDWALLRAVARADAGAGAAADRRVARRGVRPRPGLPGVPRGAQPRLARPPLGRGGGAADPARRRRDRPVRALGVQRHRAAVPDPQVRQARPAHDLAGPQGRAHLGARGDDRRRAARSGSRRCARSAGARVRPDLELREWALAQTAHEQNRPLWERLEALGIESGRLGSERVSSGGTRSEGRAGRAARSPDSAG